MTAKDTVLNLAKVVAVIALFFLTAHLILPTRPAHAAAVNLYVSPRGSDRNTGLSATTPFATIQKALDRVGPGSVVHLAPGTYREEPTTRVNGTATQPIVIEGSETGTQSTGRFTTVVQGSGRIFNVNNSYYTLTGFTIDGQPSLTGVSWPADLPSARSFKDSIQSKVADSRLIYIGSSTTARGVAGVRIDNMYLRGAGGECIRMRSGAHDNVVTNSVIEYCGLLGKGDDIHTYRYHNGEGIYLGSSPSDPTQPMYANDNSSHNQITGNVIRTFGSECVDIKENAHDNVVADNICADNDEPASFDGSNLEIRGSYNTVARNTITASRGYGLKLATDAPSYVSRGNVITGNTFSQYAASAIMNKLVSTPVTACGNLFLTGAALTGQSIAGLATPCVSSTPTSPPPSSAASSTTSAGVPASIATTTPAAVPSTATANAGAVAFEAETAARTGSMARVLRADAQQGWYLVQSDRGPGTATYTFDTAAGDYWLCARVIAPDTSSDSVYISVDGGSQTTWYFNQHLTNWSWFHAPLSLRLTPGHHTLLITGREPGTAIDAYRILPGSASTC